MWHDAVGTPHGRADGSARIVSLVPSITELICDLGLAARLVGRSGFCVHPRETLGAVPKVGAPRTWTWPKCARWRPHMYCSISMRTRSPPPTRWRGSCRT